jgi:hypothetical protein
MFTYCLVTKGRRDYLPSTLNALKVALQQSDVQVIVVDNGCPEDVSSILSDWCSAAGNKAHYVRFDINDSSAPRIWNMLRNFDIDWITFPGDDDIIRPEFLQFARERISLTADANVIASSMCIIDSNGTPTGLKRRPSEFHGDRAQYLANALHEPPFLFPGMFIKFSSVTMPLPQSRYIFDWSLSLNLIALGPVVTTEEVSINYRVHSDQESALAPNRRKYFEAQIVISRFLESNVFENYLHEMTDDQKFEFLLLISKEIPIYGDLEFGRTVQNILSLKVIDSMEDPDRSSDAMGIFAALNGVLLREGEIRTMLATTYSGIQNSKANFCLSVADGTCEILVQHLSASQFEINPLPSSVVYCSHSNGSGHYLVDCEAFRLNPAASVDSLIVRITETLEMTGDYEFKLSPFERTLVNRLRSIKSLVPATLIRRIKNILKGGNS